MKKNGFTMPEMIMTLGIICVIASILLPVLKNMATDDKEKKFQKANFLTERIISEIRADEDLYKDENLHTPTNGVITETMFCERFAQRLKIKSEISCTEHTFENGAIPEGTFTTIDGIVWNIPLTTFENDATIEIDVNGTKGPNCFASDECAEPDRFTMTVRAFSATEQEPTPIPAPEPTPTPIPAPEPNNGEIGGGGLPGVEYDNAQPHPNKDEAPNQGPDKNLKDEGESMNINTTD